MQLRIGDLFATPDHYLFALEGEQAVFLDMDRAAYHRSIFFDRRIAPASQRMLKLPVDQLAAYRDRIAGQPAPGWIFHVAHCGSTLLARALDMPGRTLVIREPVPMRQLAVEHRAVPPALRPGWDARLRLATTMLDRRYAADAPAIVKANVPVNFILPEVMALNPAMPAVLLYFALDDYLAAILRSDNHRRWLQSITGEMRAAIEARVGPLAGLGVPELAAALWLAQIGIYAEAIEAYPNVRSLDAEFLFNHPDATLAAAFDHFGAAVSGDELAAILGSDLFTTYSKNPQHGFDNAARLERRAALKHALAGEIDAARQWVHGRGRAPARLGKPLAGSSPDLI